MIAATVETSPQPFVAAVKWIAKFVPTKPIVPIQGGIRIVVADGVMTLSAYGEKVSARARLTVGGDGSGEAVVSGRLLAAVADALPAGHLTISGEDGALLMSAGRWEGELPAMDERDWSGDMEIPPTIGEAEGDVIAGLISCVAVAASDDPEKPSKLQSVGLSFSRKRIGAMAIDGGRAAVSSVDWMIGSDVSDCSATVIGRHLADAAAAVAGPDSIRIGLDEHKLSFTSPNRSVVLRQEGEAFPVTEIGKMFLVDRAEALEVDVAALAAPLKRAVVMREKEGPVRMEIAPGMVTVRVAGGDTRRRSGDEVDVDYEGEPMMLAFNPAFLGDALTSSGAKRVRIAFDLTTINETPHPVLITADENPAWRHIVMPIKLRG